MPGPLGHRLPPNKLQQSATSRIPIGPVSAAKSSRPLTSKLSATSSASLSLQRPVPPPLPPRPPPSPPATDEHGSDDRVPDANHRHSGTFAFSLSSTKKRDNGTSSGETAKPEGAPSARVRPNTGGTSSSSAPSGIPCPVSLLPSAAYAVSPPSYYANNHLKKSLPRRKKAIVPSATATVGTAFALPNGTRMASNLKMPTMV